MNTLVQIFLNQKPPPDSLLYTEGHTFDLRGVEFGRNGGGLKRTVIN